MRQSRNQKKEVFGIINPQSHITENAWFYPTYLLGRQNHQKPHLQIQTHPHHSPSWILLHLIHHFLHLHLKREGNIVNKQRSSCVKTLKINHFSMSQLLGKQQVNKEIIQYFQKYLKWLQIQRPQTQMPAEGCAINFNALSQRGLRSSCQAAYAVTQLTHAWLYSPQFLNHSA